MSDIVWEGGSELVKYRWSFDELVAFANCNMTVLAELAGVSYRQLFRWRCNNLNDRQADEVACSLGVYPSAIWPSWIDMALLAGIQRYAIVLERGGPEPVYGVLPVGEPIVIARFGSLLDAENFVTRGTADAILAGDLHQPAANQ